MQLGPDRDSLECPEPSAASRVAQWPQRVESGHELAEDVAVCPDPIVTGFGVTDSWQDQFFGAPL